VRMAGTSQAKTPNKWLNMTRAHLADDSGGPHVSRHQEGFQP